MERTTSFLISLVMFLKQYSYINGKMKLEKYKHNLSTLCTV